MELSTILIECNFTEREAAVYLAILELGDATSRSIAVKTGIQRTYVYDLVEKLLQLGFVREVKEEGKSVLVAVEPEQLVEIQKERLHRLERALPELQALQNSQIQKPRVLYFEGREGIKNLHKETLQFPGEVAAFSTPFFYTMEERKRGKEYIGERLRKQTPIRVLGEVSQEMIEAKQRDKKELRQTRMLPKELYSSSMDIVLSANSVAVIDYRKQFGFLIEGSEFAKVMKMIFELVWNSGRVVQ